MVDLGWETSLRLYVLYGKSGGTKEAIAMTEAVFEAIEEEMDTYKHEIYKKVGLEESFTVTGKRPIKVRWVTITKGDRDNPEY